MLSIKVERLGKCKIVVKEEKETKKNCNICTLDTH